MQVCFSPHIMSRVHRKHSRRRKHRFFHGLSKKLWSHLVNLKLEKQAGAKAWWTSSFSHKNSVVTSELIGSWDVLQWFFSLTVRATPVLYFSRSQKYTIHSCLEPKASNIIAFMRISKSMIFWTGSAVTSELIVFEKVLASYVCNAGHHACILV